MEYPAKPVPVQADTNWQKSVFSMFAYMLAYYFFFDQNIVNVISIVVVLFIHEAGHFLAMKQYGYSDVKMFFMPFMGAFVTGEKEKISQKQQVIVLLAGPLPGIMLGVLLNILALVADVPSLKSIANMFVYINAFNLLPIIPFDGGRLIEALFVGAREILLSIFMILSIIAVALAAYYLTSYFLLLLIVMLLLRLHMTWQTMKIRKDLKEQGIDYHRSYSELSDAEYWRIRQTIHKRIPSTSSEESMMSLVKNVLMDTPVKGLSAGAKLLVVLLWFLFLVVAPIINAGLIYFN